MKQSMKKVIMVLCAALLALCMFAFLLIPIFAATVAPTTKEEVVYGTLGADGTAENLYVVNIFNLESDGTVTDYGDYSAITNMTTTDPITQNGDMLSFPASKGRFYYQGNLVSNALPWLLTLRYTLDGQEIAPEALGGQSGHLRMELAFERNPAVDESFYNNYTLQISLSLNADRTLNLDAPGATVANAGGSKQLTYMALAGKAGTYTWEADVRDFEMDGVSINGVAYALTVDLSDIDTTSFTDEFKDLTDGVVELDDGVQTLVDGVDDLSDGADEITNGGRTLRDAGTSLAEGMYKLDEGALQLEEGAAELVTGIEKLNDGAADVSSGMSEISGGIGQTNTGLQQLSQKGETLNDGYAQMANGMLAMVETQVNAILVGKGLPTIKLTWANYKEELGKLIVVSDEMVKTAVPQVQQAIAQQLSAMSITDATQQQLVLTLALGQLQTSAATNLTDAFALAGDTLQAAQNPATPEGQQAALAVQAAAGTVATPEGQAALTAFYEKTAREQLSQATAGTDQQLKSLLEMLIGLEAYGDGLKAYTGGVTTLSQGMEKLSDGQSALSSGFSDFRDGMKTYQTGLVTFSDGIVEYRAGVGELRVGVDELAEGMQTFYNGLRDLRGGVHDLRDGVSTLKDGTGTFRESTVDLDTQVQEKIDEKIDEVTNDLTASGFTPRSYVSTKNQNVQAVQFVLQTAGIEKPEEPEPPLLIKTELTFWQKLLKLFGLYKE